MVASRNKTARPTASALDPADILGSLPTPQTGGRYLLALSGGMDSVSLLFLMHAAASSVPLRAIHVHHGLQAAADEWGRHCEAVCASLAVPLDILRVHPVLGPRRSVEAEARASRYAALRGAMQPGDVLLTAHHEDDQAETVLLQLLRGSGVRGLAAMPAVADFGPGRHARPFLGISRDRIEKYARGQGLSWIEDPSNADPQFTRSRLRQQIMPLIRRGWPAAAAMIGRVARHSAEAAGILDEVGDADLARCSGRYPESLDIPALKGLTHARRKNALRLWFERRGLPLPAAAHLQRIETEVLDAAEDATPLLSWPGVEVRRYRQQLFSMTPLPRVPGVARWDWPLGDQVPGTLTLAPGCGRLEGGLTNGAGLRRPHAGEPVSVRLSLGGERLRMQDRAHRQSLKHLQQKSGIAPWIRQRLPLIYYGEDIAAVADLWVCHGFKAAAGETGIALCWYDAPPGYPPVGTSP